MYSLIINDRIIPIGVGPAYNSGFKKLAVQWLNEHLFFVSIIVLADSFVLRSRQLLTPIPASGNYLKIAAQPVVDKAVNQENIKFENSNSRWP
jgi:hypothetical protein